MRNENWRLERKLGLTEEIIENEVRDGEKGKNKKNEKESNGNGLMVP